VESSWDEVITLLLEIGHNEDADLMRETKQLIHQLHPKVAFANDRFEDINQSYTLYRNLVLCDDSGVVMACSNKKTRSSISGQDISAESCFTRAIETNSGKEYFAQDVCPSRLEQQPSLVYSTAVREQSDTDGKVIGALGIFFDFQDEAQIILNDHMEREENGNVEDGWCSFFSNEQGVVLNSSDDYMFSERDKAHIPRSHRLLAPGKTHSSYSVVEGTESVIYSAKTDGYLDYRGLSWSSHLVVPKKAIFNSSKTQAFNDISIEELSGDPQDQ
jgi:hypothetical protein